MLNRYFPNHEVDTETDLIDDLIVEAIQIHGRHVYYLPRTGVNNDQILNEDEFADFNSAYQIEMYIETVQGFEGNGQIMSKFGLQIRDEMRVSCAISRFNQIIGQERPQGPRDGDIIYVPMLGNLWEVMFSKSDLVWYQLGGKHMYNLTLSLVEYDNQKFNTGIPEIDAYNNYTTDQNSSVPDVDRVPNAFDSSDAIQDLGDDIIDFSISNPLGGSGV